MRKTAIVTGASGGIGLETARGLALNDHHVILAVRDVKKGAAAVRDIGRGEVMHLDVADLESVRAFAAAFLARHERLDVLVNNAGIHTAAFVKSPQGVESTLATNHLGHFLLTDLLLGILRRSAPSRIVNVASEAHRGANKVSFSRTRAGLDAYAQSKLANIQFTYALARRLEGSGVSAFAVHPGSVASGWARGRDSGAFRLATLLARPFLISPAKGARTSLYAATAPELAGKNGLYLVRSKPAKPSFAARDVAAQERLWEASASMVSAARAR